jgi:uncharacterized protein
MYDLRVESNDKAKVMARGLLIIFYRNPEPGKVKSRLAASIGEEKALAVYLKLAAHTRLIASCMETDKVVCYSEYVDTEDNWLNEIFKKDLQSGSDLGERMAHAFEKAFRKGYQSVCLIGTDCPEITADVLQQAFFSLKDHDAVIGPAADGGYYLIGMNRLVPSVFKDKSWSTPAVFNDTMSDFQREGVRVHVLPTLSDIDEEKDLKGFPL